MSKTSTHLLINATVFYDFRAATNVLLNYWLPWCRQVHYSERLANLVVFVMLASTYRAFIMSVPLFCLLLWHNVFPRVAECPLFFLMTLNDSVCYCMCYYKLLQLTGQLNAPQFTLSLIYSVHTCIGCHQRLYMVFCGCPQPTWHLLHTRDDPLFKGYQYFLFLVKLSTNSWFLLIL